MADNSIKKRVHRTLERSDGGFSGFDVFIITLICLNVVVLIVETVEEIHEVSPLAFQAFDTISVAIFTVEYVLRVWSCTVDEKYGHPVWGRLRFAVTAVVFIDLLAILPFYVALLAPVGLLDLRILRFLRAVRLLARIARLSRYSSGLRTSVGVIHAKRAELITVVVFLSILLLMASSLMYFAESEAQPDKFANIPQAMWWSIITLTTVGYGDVFPVTAGGRLLAGVIAILGIGLFALPAGILGSGFMEEMNRRRQEPRRCPHCGGEIHE